MIRSYAHIVQNDTAWNKHGAYIDVIDLTQVESQARPSYELYFIGYIERLFTSRRRYCEYDSERDA